MTEKSEKTKDIDESIKNHPDIKKLIEASPKRKMANINELTTEECEDFAQQLKTLTQKYDKLFNTSFPYSSGIHQAPTDGKSYKEWHWHMSFYPPLLRSATVKKFMVGYEMFAMPQRDVTAEFAAQQLKSL